MALSCTGILPSAGRSFLYFLLITKIYNQRPNDIKNISEMEIHWTML